MPIATRELKHVHPQRAGVRVQEVLTAIVGHVINHSYKAVSEAQAITDMNARDVTPQLKAADFNELLNWVKEKNNSSAFNFVGRDITELEGEELLLTWFAENLGADAIALAWWIEDMNTATTYDPIRIRTGYDSAAGSRIQDRAIALFAVEPSFDVVEDID